MKTRKFLLIFFLAALFLQHCNKPVYYKPTGKNVGNLKTSLDSIIAQHKATIGLHVLEIETGLELGINHRVHFPMQSVYKIPLAITVLHLVEQGKIKLDQVENLVMSSITHSDNPASEKLFELIGGTKTANDFMRKNGFTHIQIGYNGAEADAEAGNGYKYSATPEEISRLLKSLHNGELLNEEHTRLLLNYMIKSKSHTRLKGLLPHGTVVAHKIGTGFNNNTHSCHDVGIIYMPNGKNLVISVFVNNAKGPMGGTEHIIAMLTKQVFEFYME